MALSPDDETRIKRRWAGRRAAWLAWARCPAGHPCVVTNYPLRRERGRLSPFPTLYWLTCPRLCGQVAHLERDGVIAAIEAQLATDASLRAKLDRDHEDYIARRWATLTVKDRALVTKEGLADYFLSRGIGGMTNRAAVKCLHLHLAHHLASGNAIGALLVARFALQPCGVGADELDIRRGSA